MTLGPSPGILADFGAVRSSTPPSGDAPDGAPAPGGAPGALFDDLVGAWLAPTPDEDDAGDPTQTVTDAVVAPFSLPLPLPLPTAAPVPSTQAAAEGTESTGTCGSLERVAAGRIDPAAAIRSSAKPMSEPTDGIARGNGEGQLTGLTPGTPVTSAQPAASRADQGDAVDTDSSTKQPPDMSVRALPVPTSGVHRQRPMDTPAGTEDSHARGVASRASALAFPGAGATSTDKSLPAPIAPVDASVGQAGQVRQVKAEPIAERIAAGSAPAPSDDAMEPAVETEAAAQHPVDKPEVKRRDGGQELPRLAKRSDHSTPVSIPQTREKLVVTLDADVAPTLAKDNADSPASQSPIGQEKTAADDPSSSSPLPGRREIPPHRPVEAIAQNASAADVQLRPAVFADVSPHTKKAAASVDPPADKVTESRDARLPNVTAAASGEASNEHDRESNPDTSHRDSADHAPSSNMRFSGSQPFVERAESRESAAGATPPPRPAVTLVHGTAPAFTQATLLQPLAVATSEVPVTAAPAPDTAERIVQSLKLQIQRGGGDAIVRLQPEHLGPVSISLRVENGTVSAVITAEQPAVAEWLQANQQSLRDGLQASGLHLERFIVQRDGQSPSDRHRREWADSQRRDFRRRSPQTNSTFEISV